MRAAPAQERLAEHRRPLDLEQEAGPAADLPHDVDLVDGLGPGPPDPWRALAALALVEPLREVPAAQPADLLAAGDPGAHPEPVADVDEVGHELAVLVRPAQEIVGGDDPVGRAGHAPIAVEAGRDERLVGQVVAAEQGGDPLVERALRQPAGGRQQAEDGPLDPVGERQRGGRDVGRIGQPPAARLDLLKAPVAGSAELVADDREQPLDLVAGQRGGLAGRTAGRLEVGRRARPSVVGRGGR